MTADPTRPEPGPDAGVDDIQTDIEQTRTELGETVESLQAKLDVKGRAQQKAADTKEQVVEKAHAAVQDDRVRRAAPVAAVVAIAAILGIIVWRRRR